MLFYVYSFRHLLGCVKQLFLPSKYYTGGVLHIPSDGDDPWKLKSTPKKNEYFEYSNKFTAKKGLSQKISERKISNQGKKHTSIIPVTWKNWPEYHPLTHPRSKWKVPPYSRLTILIVKRVYSLPVVKNLKNNANSLWPTKSTL